MRTARFEPSIGQRYLQRQDGAADRILVLTSISSPRTINESVQLSFAAEISGGTTEYSPPLLAQSLIEGKLVLQESNAATDREKSAPVALSDLVYGMSDAQRRRFTMRCSYVQMLEKSTTACSPKSKEFPVLISLHHGNRVDAARLRFAGGRADDGCEVEESKPAPTSVYRWYLRYRKSGNDLRVLAQEVFAIRTRKSRKPRERELLDAFLHARAAEIVRHPISALTEDFNRLLARTDPLHTGPGRAVVYPR